MKLIHSYWTALVISAIFFVMYMFAPWAYGNLDSDQQNLLAYGGFGASINLPEWSFWVVIVLNLASYIGMALFRKLFRALFLAILVFNLLLSPLSGIFVITGVEAFIIDISTLLSGFVIALSYYTRLNDKFY